MLKGCFRYDTFPGHWYISVQTTKVSSYGSASQCTCLWQKKGYRDDDHIWSFVSDLDVIRNMTDNCLHIWRGSKIWFNYLCAFIGYLGKNPMCKQLQMSFQVMEIICRKHVRSTSLFQLQYPWCTNLVNVTYLGFLFSLCLPSTFFLPPSISLSLSSCYHLLLPLLSHASSLFHFLLSSNFLSLFSSNLSSRICLESFKMANISTPECHQRWQSSLSFSDHWSGHRSPLQWLRCTCAKNGTWMGQLSSTLESTLSMSGEQFLSINALQMSWTIFPLYTFIIVGL